MPNNIAYGAFRLALLFGVTAAYFIFFLYLTKKLK